MTPTNPIEILFIQRVNLLLDELFIQKNDPDSYHQIYNQLLAHLEAAQRKNMLLYEAEVYNALGHYVLEIEVDQSTTLDYFHQAYELGERAQNSDFVARMLNNIGTVYIDVLDIEQAWHYFDRCIQVATNAPQPMLDIIFAYGNLASVSMLKARWDQALEDIHALARYSTEVTVTAQDRFDYGRAIQYRYVQEVYIFLAQQKYDQARESLNMAIQLADQINTRETVDELLYLPALCDLIIDNYSETYDVWWQAERDNEQFLPTNRILILSLLNIAGLKDYAIQLMTETFNAISDSQVKERLHQILLNHNISL